VLHMCPVSNSTLAENSKYYLLSLCASHIRVMPDRLDGPSHIMKQNEQRRYGNDWCKGQRRTFCTKYNTTSCIQCFTLYHKWSFVLLIWWIKTSYTLCF
jgi:hypothetical protein